MRAGMCLVGRPVSLAALAIPQKRTLTNVVLDLRTANMTHNGGGKYTAGPGNHGIAFSGPWSRDVEIEVDPTGNLNHVSFGVSTVDPSIATDGDNGHLYVDRGLEAVANCYFATEDGSASYSAAVDYGARGNVPWKVIYRYATGNLEFYKNGVLQDTQAGSISASTPVWLHMHIIVATEFATVRYAGSARS